MEIEKIPNIKYIDIAPYGATAMASIRANVDAMLSAPSFEVLQNASTSVENALNVITSYSIHYTKLYDS